ncbi:hypothetical protein HKX48_008932 [Thoreauomyces humboldtii]|nr:hypothetical protein HKX48_008932 [Thoreauomyces humboldtii]
MRRLSRPSRPNFSEDGNPPKRSAPSTPTPTLSPYTRRERRPSVNSLTSSEGEGEGDTPLPLDPANANPQSIFKLKHSEDRLQTQIRIIETIDQLKHAAYVTKTLSESASSLDPVVTAELRTAQRDARYNYAKYLVENVRYLELGEKEHIAEAMLVLKELCSEKHPDAQFTYASLLITGIPGSRTRHRPDYEAAFPLYLAASESGHADACYHAALCYEHGRGTSAQPDPVRAVKKYRKAAIAHHPGALYRLGTVLATGELGQQKNAAASVKWFVLSARFATAKHPHALYQLALLHEHGDSSGVFPNGHADPAEALRLLVRAADLGHVASQVRLGHSYQFGDLGAPVDPAASIRSYGQAARKGSAEAMYELSAWHFTGAEDPVTGTPVLPVDEREAYLWARRAAERGLAKAEYAVGFYSETAVGVPRDMDEALSWYTLAATHGDDHAIARLKGSQPTSPADPAILAAVVGELDALSLSGVSGAAAAASVSAAAPSVPHPARSVQSKLTEEQQQRVSNAPSSASTDYHFPPLDGTKLRREGLDRLYTVRAYRRLRNQVSERRSLRKAGGL